MTRDDNRDDTISDVSADCPLSDREQTRNIILYATIWGLIYLSAPVLYIGLVQAALFEKLGASKATSNLPSSVYLWLSPIPVLIAWFIPYVRLLKTVVCVAFLGTSAMGMVVVLALLLPTSGWVIPVVLLHAGILSVANGTSHAFLWEALGRGVSESRRGQAFSLAFGAGPILAVIGSLGSQAVLDGKLGLHNVTTLDFRLGFAVLYGASVPICVLAALIMTKMIIPLPSVEPVRQTFVSGIFGGFGDFLRTRWIAITIFAYLLVYAGHIIAPTMTLYTKSMTGTAAQDYVGYQNALWFSFKILAGFFLGWLITRTHPKAGLLATAALCTVGVLWALLAPGIWFLLSFGFMGAGELFGAYFPNYVLCCSQKSKMRRNMTFMGLLTALIGFMPLLYGFIVDSFASTGNDKLGYQMSFVAALVPLIAGIALVLFGLPRRPTPDGSPVQSRRE